MSNKNLLSGRDKELQELAEQYELAMSAKQPFYLDADDLADRADWYGTKKNYDKALEIAEYGIKLHPDSTALMIEYAYLHLDIPFPEKRKLFLLHQVQNQYRLWELSLLCFTFLNRFYDYVAIFPVFIDICFSYIRVQVIYTIIHITA